MKSFYEKGHIFEKTEVWGEGLDKWYHLSSVVQFRWTIGFGSVNSLKDSDLGTTPVSTLYNFTELCVVVLDILIQMCSFFPSR